MGTYSSAEFPILFGYRHSQVLSFHPDCKVLHIGADEVFGIATCFECRSKALESGVSSVFIDHLMKVLRYCTEKKGVKPLCWHDMMDRVPTSALVPVAELAEVVVWSYGVVVEDAAPDSLWARLEDAGFTIWGASSYKGASSPDASWVPLGRHVANHESWVKRKRKSKLKVRSYWSLQLHGLSVMPCARVSFVDDQGLFLTGWSRFNHTAALCETLPAGLPSLALCLAVMMNNGYTEELQDEVFGRLGLEDLSLLPTSQELLLLPFGNFPGASVFRAIGALVSSMLCANSLRFPHPLCCHASHLPFIAGGCSNSTVPSGRKPSLVFAPLHSPPQSTNVAQD